MDTAMKIEQYETPRGFEFYLERIGQKYQRVRDKEKLKEACGVTVLRYHRAELMHVCHSIARRRSTGLSSGFWYIDVVHATIDALTALYCALRGCLKCGSRSQVRLYLPGSHYVNKDGSYDPVANCPFPLCSVCSEEEAEYWSDMWAEYYSGLL